MTKISKEKISHSTKKQLKEIKNKSLKTKEEWSLFLNNMLGEYLEGPPTFIEMVPSLKA